MQARRQHRRRSWLLYGWLCALFLGLLACDGVLGGGNTPTDGQETPDAAAPDAPARETDTTGTERSPDAPLAPHVHPAYDKTWYGGAVLYQIFVRSFADSDGDGIGDIKGITAHLDHLNTGQASSTKDLKVNGIWLTPIFRSGSYHGYDVQDYLSLDPAYGSMEDFKTLLAEAHKRGIKIILDLVINHTSRKHPWFQDASSAPDAAKRDWYVWRTEDPKWPHPFTVGANPWHAHGGHFFYGVFSPSMPDLNLRHAPVKEELKRIFKHWLDVGVDGFRLDAIRYLVAPSADKQSDAPETHAVLKELAAYVRSIRPDALLAGEAWTTIDQVAKYFGNGDEMDICFHFEMIDAMDRAFQRARASSLKMALEHMHEAYRELNFNAPILGNHDHKRLMSRLFHDHDAAKVAATLLLTLPGTPFIYYGEEIGIGNSSAGGDIAKRAPMQWDTSAKAGFTKGIPWTSLFGRQDSVSVSTQDPKADSLLQHYRLLSRLRAKSPALRFGSFKTLDLPDAPAGLAYLRKQDTQTLLVILNFSETSPINISLDATQLGLQGTPPTQLQEQLSNKTLSTSNPKPNSLTIPPLSPYSAYILTLP